LSTKNTECKPTIYWCHYVTVADSNNNCNPHNILSGQSSNTFFTDYAACMQLNYVLDRNAQITGARLPGLLIYIWCHLIFVSP